MGLDLLTCSELRDAQSDLASAHARQAEAARRHRHAPHGLRTERLSALKAAVQASLRAELHLVKVRAAVRFGG